MTAEALAFALPRTVAVTVAMPGASARLSPVKSTAMRDASELVHQAVARPVVDGRAEADRVANGQACDGWGDSHVRSSWPLGNRARGG